MSPFGPQTASLLELLHWSLGDDDIHSAYWDSSRTQSKHCQQVYRMGVERLSFLPSLLAGVSTAGSISRESEHSRLWQIRVEFKWIGKH